jgi:hypothetical protein
MRKFVNLLAAVSMSALSVGLTTNRAFAFAETTDRTEAYTILPNQSAFWVPDVGANQKSQAKFESEQYYNDNKIAAKRFQIQHTKLSGSGGYGWGAGWDLFVPTGRLYIVDRTPFSREWVDAGDRGTSTKKEGFPCQSKEGLNVTVGVSIGASVSEDNAAKFLYNFGVTPPKGSPTDPQVIFASIYYGRSLEEVMDDVGRKKVQTLVCNEIGSRTFDAVSSDAIVEMANVEKKIREYFDNVGITLNFIGWGDTFIFDKDVQDAVNTKYIAEHLASVLPIMQAIAQIKIQEGLGGGLDKHGLPMVISPGLIDAITNLVPHLPISALSALPAKP